MAVRPLFFNAPDLSEDKIGKSRIIGWPVAAYRVTLPQSATVLGHQLNPFEKVVLELLEVLGNVDLQTIANETCIPIDLVRSITLKLRDQGLVDDNYSVLRIRSEEFLESRVDTYSTAIVFRELVGGRVLPYVHSLDKDSVLETQDLRLDRIIGDSQEFRHMGSPLAREVLAAIKEMKHRARTHGKHLSIPVIEQIRVNKRSERHHLACSMFIGKHDADFRIVDPFGIGFSQALEQSFASRLENDDMLQEWMSAWHKSLLHRDGVSGTESRTVDVEVAEGEFHTYSKLIKALTPAPGSNFRSSGSIYASLEWALFYSCAMNEPETAIDILQHIPNDGYPQFLASVAERIGFSIPRAGFRALPGGKFTDFMRERAEMETVLAISLIQANSNPRHRLRVVAERFPDFIESIRTLGQHRSQHGHGRSYESIEEIELDSDPMMREVISTLLPAIEFDTMRNPINAGVQADLGLLARSNLLELLGYEVFEKIGLSARASLLSAEKFLCSSSDDDDARLFVSDLYSALQAIIRKLMQESRLSESPISNFLEIAEKRAFQYRLGVLPTSLRTVSVKRIKSALAGDDPTLGALVLAMILRVEGLVLERIAIAQGDFLDLVADVIQQRGHANEPVFMSKSESLYLRNRIINTVKTLTSISK
jgi:hypothetical protein